MRPNLAVLAPLAAFLGLTAPGLAQDRMPAHPAVIHPADLTRFVTPIHTAADDPEGGRYGLWGAGADYKAGFHDGVVFIPYLGKDYPRTRALRWQTEAVRVGATDLLTDAAPTRSHDDTRFVIDHGGVQETYELRLDGLEQTFVVAQRPAAEGDLVVTGRLDTSLRAAPFEDRHQEIVFQDDDGRSIAGYGAATAIDAAGRRWPMTTTWAEGEVRLTLAAAAVTTARYPLTVDPLLRHALVDSTGSAFGTTHGMDLACTSELSSSNVWIGYARAVSATDSDLWLIRSHSDFSSRLAQFADLSTSWSSEEPAVAYLGGADRGIVVFTRDFGSSRNIRWHAHPLNNYAQNSNYGFIPATTNNWRPDVGGIVDGGSSQRCGIVFQHEPVTVFANTETSEVQKVVLDFAASASLEQGDPLYHGAIDPYADTDQERPAITSATGIGFVPYWGIVWQKFYTPTDRAWGGRIALLTSLGGITRPTSIAGAYTRHALGLKIEGPGSEYLIAYSSSLNVELPGKPSTLGGHTLRTRIVDWTGGGFTSPHGENVLQTRSQPDLEVGGLAHDSNTGSHWLLLSRDDTYAAIDSLGFRGRSLYRAEAYRPVAGRYTKLGGVTFNARLDEFPFLFSEAPASPHPLYGGRFEYRFATPARREGTSCSPFQLDWIGSQQIGTAGVVVRATPISGSDPNPAAQHFVVVSLFQDDRSLGFAGFDPRCRLLVDMAAGLIDTVPATRRSGGYEIRFDLPEDLRTSVLRFQGVHQDATGGGFQTTTRLEAVVVK